MKLTIAVLATAFAAGSFVTAGAATVIGGTNFDALANGDLNGQTSTNGSFSVAWTGDGNTDVSTGTITTAAGSTMWGDFDSATEATINTSNVVFFSLDMHTTHTAGTNRFGLTTVVGGNFGSDTLSIGQRLGGVQTRIGTFVDAADVSGSVPGATTTATEAFTNSGWAANTWFTLVGKLTIDRTSGAADTLQFWLLPQGTVDFDNLGTPYITMNGVDFINSTNQITGFAFNGNEGGNSYDNLVIAIPEPSCALLGGLGVLGLAGRRRRK